MKKDHLKGRERKAEKERRKKRKEGRGRQWANREMETVK